MDSSRCSGANNNRTRGLLLAGRAGGRRVFTPRLNTFSSPVARRAICLLGVTHIGREKSDTRIVICCHADTKSSEWGSDTRRFRLGADRSSPRRAAVPGIPIGFDKYPQANTP